MDLVLKAFLAAIPLCLLAAGFLSISRRILEYLVAAAFLLLALLPSFGAPEAVWFGVAAMPFAAGAARKLADNPDSRDAMATARRMILQSMMVFAATVSAGLLVSPR